MTQTQPAFSLVNIKAARNRVNAIWKNIGIKNNAISAQYPISPDHISRLTSARSSVVPAVYILDTIPILMRFIRDEHPTLENDLENAFAELKTECMRYHNRNKVIKRPDEQRQL